MHVAGEDVGRSKAVRFATDFFFNGHLPHSRNPQGVWTFGSVVHWHHVQFGKKQTASDNNPGFGNLIPLDAGYHIVLHGRDPDRLPFPDERNEYLTFLHAASRRVAEEAYFTHIRLGRFSHAWGLSALGVSLAIEARQYDDALQWCTRGLMALRPMWHQPMAFAFVSQYVLPLLHRSRWDKRIEGHRILNLWCEVMDWYHCAGDWSNYEVIAVEVRHLLERITPDKDSWEREISWIKRDQHRAFKIFADSEASPETYEEARSILSNVLSRLDRLRGGEETQRERENTLRFLLEIELAIREPDQDSLHQILSELSLNPNVLKLSDPDDMEAFLKDFKVVDEWVNAGLTSSLAAYAVLRGHHDAFKVAMRWQTSRIKGSGMIVLADQFSKGRLQVGLLCRDLFAEMNRTNDGAADLEWREMVVRPPLLHQRLAALFDKTHSCLVKIGEHW